MASWLTSALISGLSGPVQALAVDIVLCSWVRHFTLTVPLSALSPGFSDRLEIQPILSYQVNPI